MKKPGPKETPAVTAIQTPAPPAAEAQQVQNVNPVDVAKLSLMFLARCTLTPAERGQFAVCEQMMQAIASGQLVLSQPAPAAAPLGNGHDAAAAGARAN